MIVLAPAAALDAIAAATTVSLLCLVRVAEARPRARTRVPVTAPAGREISWSQALLRGVVLLAADLLAAGAAKHAAPRRHSLDGLTLCVDARLVQRHDEQCTERFRCGLAPVLTDALRQRRVWEYARLH